MKHCAKCRLEQHLHLFKVKRLGFAGAILMIAHLLFHVVECLILPSLLVAFSSHLHEETAVATDAGDYSVQYLAEPHALTNWHQLPGDDLLHTPALTINLP